MLSFLQDSGSPLPGLLILAALAILIFFIVRSVLSRKSPHQDIVKDFQRAISNQETAVSLSSEAKSSENLQIKTCPACKRTYSDAAISFCLADGSLLSSPMSIDDDPNKTVAFSRVNAPELPPTQAYNVESDEDKRR